MSAQLPVTRILPAHECWELLRATTVGRLGLCRNAQPDIFPINYIVDHGTIIFRTSEGTKSHDAEKALVAFEADGLYPDLSRDLSADSAASDETMVWSVVVKGHAATIATTSELMDTVQLPLHPWESGRKDRFVRVVPETITGRAFQRSNPRAPINPEIFGS